MEHALPLDELAKFTRQEQQQLEQLGLESTGASTTGRKPSASTVRFLLNYSKALSVRPSDSMEHIETILN